MSKATILLMDDDNSILLSVQYYLEDDGYTVISAASGEEGLTQLSKETPDLIITDMKMPGICGAKLIEHINAEYQTIPIIVLSGNGIAEDVITALRSGAWDYILKPIQDFAILSLTIENALEKKRLIESNIQYQESLEATVEDQTIELLKKNKELEIYQHHLESVIEERTVALTKSQNMLIDSAHKAGQIDIAIDIIHNIGNTVNSINTSIFMFESELNNIKETDLQNVIALFERKETDLYTFLVTEKKAKTLHEYFKSYKNNLDSSTTTLSGLLARIQEKNMEVISILKSYNRFIENLNISGSIEVNATIENTLEVFKKSITDQNIDISLHMPVKYFAQSSKDVLIDIILRLLKKISHCNALDNKRKTLKITLSESDNKIYITFIVENLFLTAITIKSLLTFSLGISDQIQEIESETNTIALLNVAIDAKQINEHAIEYLVTVPRLK